MDQQLDKIIKIIRRTGDKVVVLKDDTEFIVLSLDDYYRLIQGDHPLSQLSESQMLDKINRDIAVWRESQQELSSAKGELDFLDEPSSPRYDSADLSVQTALDELTGNIFSQGAKDSLPSKQPPASPSFDWPRDKDMEDEDIAGDGNINANIKSDDAHLDPVDPFASEFDLSEDFDFDAHLDFDQDSEAAPELADLAEAQDEDLFQDFKPQLERSARPAQTPINNFGYPNPTDSDLDDFASGDSADLSDNGQELDDFPYIPPPPDKSNK